MNQERQSSTARLNSLPEVFSVETLQKSQNLSSKSASVYLARWQANDLIRRLGPRCGIWVNLTKNKDNTVEEKWRNRLVAIKAKHPDGIIFGLNASADHFSLTNSIEDKTKHTEGALHLLVPQTSSKAQIDGVHLIYVPNKAYKILAQNSVLESNGLLQLNKEATLAEMMVNLSRHKNPSEATMVIREYDSLSHQRQLLVNNLKKELTYTKEA